MKILRQLFGPLIVLSALGFAASLVLHVAALLGWSSPFKGIFLLCAGVLVVGVPGSFAAHDLAPGIMNPWRYWKATMMGCPPWMRYAGILLTVYFLVTFFRMAAAHQDSQPLAGHIRPWELQMFTSALMALYFGFMSNLYSAKQLERTGRLRLCTNGHRVSLSARYCEECGSSIK